ncbi:hypothetical protein [Sulfobacillus thermosulfidooxidans]|nr:hypothetical protein [Sulfobacillus thermosulfidooxidans]
MNDGIEAWTIDPVVIQGPSHTVSHSTQETDCPGGKLRSADQEVRG